MSPLITENHYETNKSLICKQYFHLPINNLSYLLHRIEYGLLRRWQALSFGKKVSEVVVHLFREKNDCSEILRIIPEKPHNSLNLFLNKIEIQLAHAEIQNNPIKEMQIQVIPFEEKKSRFYIFKKLSNEEFNEEEFLLALQKQDSPEKPAIYTSVKLKSIV